ncbi:MAG: hypothetical protein H7A21_14990 [Spirochaetales bacterium]|nr:hypothetical protein [Leptospiraceae bacterium]MCP5482740.1 hypothetical protein [Spirochaetales bacterium]MCP5485234.1 hypothetical protein [Spirochaetales bacterium]
MKISRWSFVAPLILLFASACSDARLEEMSALPLTPGDRAEATRLHQAALQSHRSGDYAASAATWALAAKADPGWYVPFYNLACATSMQGEPELALEFLKLAGRRETPANFPATVAADSDLAAVRDLSEYQSLFAGASASPDPVEQQLYGAWSSGECNPAAGFDLAGGAYGFAFAQDGSFTASVATGPSFRGDFTVEEEALRLHFQTREFFNPGSGELEETPLDTNGEIVYRFSGAAMCFSEINGGESAIHPATGCYCRAR